MSLTDKHRWAVIISANIDYTAVQLHERIGEPMNMWRPRSESNKDVWEKRDEGMCYLRRPEGRSTSDDVSMVSEQFGFAKEKDARDWFEFFTQGPKHVEVERESTADAA